MVQPIIPWKCYDPIAIALRSSARTTKVPQRRVMPTLREAPGVDFIFGRRRLMAAGEDSRTITILSRRFGRFDILRLEYIDESGIVQGCTDPILAKDPLRQLATLIR